MSELTQRPNVNPYMARVISRAAFDAKSTARVEVRPGTTVLEAMRAKLPGLADHELTSLRVTLHRKGSEHSVVQSDRWEKLDSESKAEFWGRVKLKPGTTLIVTDVPMGQGVRPILSIIISLAALVFAPYLAPAALGAVGQGLVAAGLGIAGQLLANALVPLKTAKKDDPTYFAQTFRNQPNPNGMIPLAVGERYRAAPPYAVPPYISIVNRKQYLTTAFVCGFAPMKAW